MLSLLAALSALSISLLQTSTFGTPADVSALKVGAPTIVAELDLGKLTGELRQIAWSSDASELYVETVEGKPPSEKLHHFTIPLAGGVPAPLEDRPAWPDAYWAFKSDRVAPGMGSPFIDVAQKYDALKFGTGSAGALR